MSASRPDPGERWRTLLDAYEATLEEHRRHLSTTAAAVVDHDLPSPPAPFVPPVGIGPLPAELAERAQRLVETTRELARVARDVLAQLPPMQPVRPAPPAARATARFDRGL